MDHKRVDTTLTALPDTDDLPSSPEDNETMRKLPRIRGDPKFEATTQSRRISVANPHSIKYNGPHSASIDEDSSHTSTSGGDDEDSHSPSHLNASNEAQHLVTELAQHLSHHHANDPSVSDVQYPGVPLHSQHYQPLHQPLPDDEYNGVNGDDEVTPSPSQHTVHSQLSAISRSQSHRSQTAESKDPFAMLGAKQESVPHPHIERIQKDEERQREIDALKNQHYHQIGQNRGVQNQYAPAAMLPAKHLMPRHHSSRLNMNHNRSATAMIPSINRAQTLATGTDLMSGRRKMGSPGKRRKRGTSVNLQFIFNDVPILCTLHFVVYHHAKSQGL